MNRIKTGRLNLDNKGFSLVELIVCILILSLVSGIIVMFVASSTKSYNVVYDEVNMQTEADVAMTYIDELAVEAKGYVVDSFTNDAGVACTALCIEAPDPDGGAYPDSYYIIWHETDCGKLRFCKLVKDSTSLIHRDGVSTVEKISDISINYTLKKAGVYGNKENFLAEYVTSFRAVPPTDPDTFPVLQVSIGLEFGGSTFVASKNIASRNL